MTDADHQEPQPDGASVPAEKESTLAALWKALREPGQVRFLLLVQLLSGFNAGILIPVLPLYFLEKGLSFGELGSLFSLVALGTVGIQILTGRHAQIFAKPKILAPLLLVPVVTFPLYLWADSLAQFALITTAGAVAGAAAGPGLQVKIASLSTPEQRAFMYSKFGLVQSFSYAGGVLLGGSLLAVGFIAVFIVGTGLSFAGFLATFRMLWTEDPELPSTKQDPHEPSRAASLSSALMTAQAGLAKAHARLQSQASVPVQSMRNMYWVAMHQFLFGLTLAIYPIYFPRHLTSLGLPIGLVGVVVAASWVVFGLVQPFGARVADRTGWHKWIIITSVGVAALLNWAMATMSLWWVVAAWVLLGIADGAGRPVTNALLVHSVSVNGQGSAFGLSMAANTIARVVAPLAMAGIVIQEGIGQGLLWVSIVLWISTLPISWVQALPKRSTRPSSVAPSSRRPVAGDA